jgi:hypothetical protein
MTAPATKIGIEWTDVTKAALQRGLNDNTTAVDWNGADITGLDDIALIKETPHTIAVDASTTTDTAGAALTITAGDGAATNANGGALTLDAGAKAGSGTSGAITIGGTAANSLALGRSGKDTNVKGTLTVDGASTLTGAVTATAGAGCGGAQDSKAILSCSSTTKGFLPPVMTTTQRNAISSPTEGLMIYNSTTHKLNVYTGSAWEAVTSA